MIDVMMNGPTMCQKKWRSKKDGAREDYQKSINRR
jgi:hypothetical protein